jgi:hypothetical protein
MVYLVCLLRKLMTGEFKGSIVGRLFKKTNRNPIEVSRESQGVIVVCHKRIKRMSTKGI